MVWLSAMLLITDELGNSVTDRNGVFDALGNVVSIWGLTVIKNKNQTVDRVTVMWNEAAEILENLKYPKL